MRIAYLLLVTNVISQEADEEEGPQIDPRALFMTWVKPNQFLNRVLFQAVPINARIIGDSFPHDWSGK